MYRVTLTRCGSGCSIQGKPHKTPDGAFSSAVLRAGSIADGTPYVDPGAAERLFGMARASVLATKNCPRASATDGLRTIDVELERF